MKKKLLLVFSIFLSVVLFFVFGGWKLGVAFVLFVVSNHLLDYLVNSEITDALIKLSKR